MKLPAQKRNGKLEFRRDLLKQWVDTHKDGTYFWVEVRKKVKRTSPPMRGYYFGVALPKLMEHVGYEPEQKLQVHTYVKALYFNATPDKRGIYTDLPSVWSNNPDIDVPQQKKFIDWFVRLAAQQGCVIPDPGEG